MAYEKTIHTWAYLWNLGLERRGEGDIKTSINNKEDWGVFTFINDKNIIFF